MILWAFLLDFVEKEKLNARHSLLRYIILLCVWIIVILGCQIIRLNHSPASGGSDHLGVCDDVFSILLPDLVWFGLVWFDDISTIVGYLMPNLFLNM